MKILNVLLILLSIQFSAFPQSKATLQKRNKTDSLSNRVSFRKADTTIKKAILSNLNPAKKQSLIDQLMDKKNWIDVSPQHFYTTAPTKL